MCSHSVAVGEFSLPISVGYIQTVMSYFLNVTSSALPTALVFYLLIHSLLLVRHHFLLHAWT